MVTGKADPTVVRYLKSVALHHWLFGYELPDTVLVLEGARLHVVCGKTKARLLEPCREEVKEKAGIELEVYVKPKGDGRAQLEEALGKLKGGAAAGGPVGVFSKEKHEGELAKLWAELLGGAELETPDVARAVANVLAAKDEGEQLNMRKAANLSAKVMDSFLKETILHHLDGEQKVKHSDLSLKAEDAIQDPEGSVNVKLHQDRVEICYSPVVQSGGTYDLKVSALANDDVLTGDVIICSLGARYLSYCSNVARTYLIDATDAQKGAYEALLKAQAAALGALRPGREMREVHAAVRAALEEAGLGESLTKNVGFATGIEYRDSAFSLNAKNETKIQAGMVFNLCIGLQNLESGAGEGSSMPASYALQLADTVLVAAERNEILTKACPSAWSQVAWNFADNDDDAKDKTEWQAPKSNVILDDKLRGKDTEDAQAVAQRKARQEELLQKTNEETLARLTAQARKLDQKAIAKRGEDPTAYESSRDFFTQGKNALIRLDPRRECLVLPLFGYSVPFHVSTIRNITHNQEGERSYVRVNFVAPGAGFGGSSVTPPAAQRHPTKTFLREASFRARDGRHAAKIVAEVKTLIRQYKLATTEKEDKATLVEQEKLVLAKGRIPRLSGVFCRPNIGAARGRKQGGYLECHVNGFRYQNAKGETIPIVFRNVKHAFFQPADNEMVCLLHFRLHNEIMAGKKKTRDMQFYTEVMDVVQTLDAGRRSAYDPDEIEEEQRERERRNRVNAGYQAFVKQVQQIWERDFRNLDLEFDIPFRELGFQGVPHKSTALVLPTVHCIVELIEQPAFVVSLVAIEIVNLERVGFGLKNFDLAIVFKDFTREVHRIDAIPADKVEQVKEWLTSMNIKYYESKMNLVWKPILKTILADPEAFVEDGGWEFLNMEASDSEGEEEEESEGFEPDSSEMDSEESSSDDDESEFDEEEEDSEDEEEELEEEGKDWDELEAEALESDRKRAREGDLSDDERKRKPKGGPRRRR